MDIRGTEMIPWKDWPPSWKESPFLEIGYAQRALEIGIAQRAIDCLQGWMKTESRMEYQYWIEPQHPSETENRRRDFAAKIPGWRELRTQMDLRVSPSLIRRNKLELKEFKLDLNRAYPMLNRYQTAYQNTRISQWLIQSGYHSVIERQFAALQLDVTSIPTFLSTLNNFLRSVEENLDRFYFIFILKFYREMFNQVLQWIVIFTEELEWSTEHSFFLVIHLAWRLLQIFELILNDAWDPGLPNSTSVSWPWTVKASLVVLWGVCWMFVASSPSWNQPQGPELEDYSDNTPRQAQDFSQPTPFTNGQYNYGTTTTHSSFLLLPVKSPVFDFQPQSYTNTIGFNTENVFSDPNTLDIEDWGNESFPDLLYRNNGSFVSPIQDHDQEVFQQRTPAIAFDLPFSNRPSLSDPQDRSNITQGVIQDAIGHVGSSSSNPPPIETGQTDYINPNFILSPQSPFQYNRSEPMNKHDQSYNCTTVGCNHPRSFNRKADLERHQREVHDHHGNRKDFRCNHLGCKRSFEGEGFYRKGNLADHLKRVHQNAEPSALGLRLGGATYPTQKRKRSRQIEGEEDHADEDKESLEHPDPEGSSATEIKRLKQVIEDQDRRLIEKDRQLAEKDAQLAILERVVERAMNGRNQQP